MDLTAQLNTQNIRGVREQIARKIGGPSFATGLTVKKEITDMDHHPYTRWFRGVYYYPDPVVMEREAGWRPNQNSCYTTMMPEEQPETCDSCFEVACSTRLPCYPEYSSLYKEKNSLDKTIDRTCVVQYR